MKRYGKDNPNWRGGKTIKYCIDCNIRVCRNNKGGRCKSCSKLGKLNSFYGHAHNKKTRKKMIISNAKRDKGTYRQGKASFDVQSRAMKLRWERASESERWRLIKPFVMAGMKACKKASKTKIENIINDILVKNGFSFHRNKQIGIYNVDFLVGNKAIECLGDYWHCNPSIYSPDYYNKSIKLVAADKWIKDENRAIKLMSKGISIMMLWESDIKQRLELVEKSILKFLKNE